MTCRWRMGVCLAGLAEEGLGAGATELSPGSERAGGKGAAARRRPVKALAPLAQ